MTSLEQTIDPLASAPAAESDNFASADDNAEGIESAPHDPEAQIRVRALISTKEAGVVIGKGGANVNEVREKTGVTAGVSKVIRGVYDRVLSISGNVDQISRAYSLIAQTILENPITGNEVSDTPITPPPNAVTSIRLLVSHNLMGTVIGRQGLKIKHIQDISGARMVASKEMLPQSTERIVEVQGTVEAIRIAVLEIAKCLQAEWEKSEGSIPYHPSYTEGAGILAAGAAGGLQPQTGRGGGASGAGAFGRRRSSNANSSYLTGAMAGLSLSTGMGRRSIGGGAFSGNGTSTSAGRLSVGAGAGAVVSPGGDLSAAALAPGMPPPRAVVDSANVRTQNISIPADMVGCIIGKGGSKITEIRRLSGSRISIAKAGHDQSGERMFTIQGSPEANEKALFLLYTQLESEKERRTTNANEAGAEGAAEDASGAALGAEGETEAAAATPSS